MKFKYIIMAGGVYHYWETPKHMTPVKGEPNIARTIRLLRENGVTDIAISSNDERFEQFGVPVLKHHNSYRQEKDGTFGVWLDAFYPTNDPVCYLFGDVVFSLAAIKTIVETETDSIEFFASAEPLPVNYPKKWAEPFAYKVVDTKQFRAAIERTKVYDKRGYFKRMAVSWELWQVIKGTPLNIIDYTNYTAINDYTCDIDHEEDVAEIERLME